MFKNKLPIILFYAGAIILLLFVCSSFFVWNINYEKTIQQITESLNRKDLYKLLTDKYFTNAKFLFVKKIIILLSIFSALALFFYAKKKDNIIIFYQKQITCFSYYIISFFNALKNENKMVSWFLWLSVLLILIRSFYFSSQYAIQYDEAWNYNYFLYKNFFYSCVAYNNYPLHNIVTWCFLQFTPHTVFFIRIPVIVVGLLSCLSVFVVVKKIFKHEWLALLAMIAFASVPYSLSYLFLARGPMFELFFILWIFYFIQKKIQTSFTFSSAIKLSILNALGTFSMLSHAYFIVFSFGAIIFILLFDKRFKEIKNAFYYIIFSIGFSLILLLPMLLGTGVSLGTSTAGSGINMLEIKGASYFNCYSIYATGIPYLLFALVFFTLIYYFIKRKFHSVIFFNLIILIAVVLIPIITKATPPARSMGMLVLVYVTSICVLFTVKKLSLYVVLFILGIAIYTNATIDSKHYFNWSKCQDKICIEASNALLQNNVHSIKSTFNEFYYYIPFVYYVYNFNHQSILYNSTINNTSRNNVVVKKYDAFVVPINDSLTQGKIIYENKKMKILLQNN